MASISFSNIDKRFGKTQVIHDVNFDIADGEFIGRSKRGKSTLLRLLAGLEETRGGEIGIDGRVINRLDSKDRDIAMVFQNHALHPPMTVRDNMAFSTNLRKASASQIDRHVDKAAPIVNLCQLLDRYPRELPGGQRRRVAMGRATVRDPQVFLFDEPLSNLDAKLRVVMRAEIKSLHQRLKTTTVYVTHDQIEAMTSASVLRKRTRGPHQRQPVRRADIHQPAKAYGPHPRKGPIAAGSDTYQVVWDELAHVITNTALHHALDYTPHEGMALSAWPARTMCWRTVPWDAGRLHPATGRRQFLARGTPTLLPRARNAC